MKLPKLLIGILLIVGIVFLINNAQTTPEVAVFREINPGNPAVMEVIEPKISVSKVEIRVKEEVSNIEVAVALLSKKPDAVFLPLGTAYQYLDINADNLPLIKIDKVTFDFKVEQEWISQNNINPDAVALNRFTVEWEKLPIQKINEDSRFVYYKAESSGFSYFVVTGEKFGAEELVRHYDTCNGSGFVWFEGTNCSTDSDCSGWAEKNASELESLGFEKNNVRCCPSSGYCGYYSYIEKEEEEEEEKEKTSYKKEKLTKEDINQIVFVSGLENCGLRGSEWVYSSPSYAFTSKIKEPCQVDMGDYDEEGNVYLVTLDRSMEYFRYVNIEPYELLPGEECGANLVKEGYCDTEPLKGGVVERTFNDSGFWGFEGYSCVIEEKPKEDRRTFGNLSIDRCGCKNLDNEFLYNGEWLGVCAGGYEFIIKNYVKLSRASEAKESMVCLPKVTSMEPCMQTLVTEINRCLSE